MIIVLKADIEADTPEVQRLIALAEGGYAVEIADVGATHLVAVEAGMYADGLVEVTSAEIVAGTLVVVP